MANRHNPSRSRASQRWQHVRLVLAGGNALAAYQGGAYEALHERGLRPELIAATSMGAVNAALLTASPPDERVRRLRAFWQTLAIPVVPAWNAASQRSAKRLAALTTRLFGHAQIFAPTLPRLAEWMPAGRRGLYGLERLRATLERAADFAALRTAPCRLVVHATDLATGDPVLFRSQDGAIGALQLQACCALVPDADPVTLDGRVLGDGGFSHNLPIAFALSPLPRVDTLCIAVDLFDPRAQRLGTLDDMYQRRIDLLLGNQSRLAIELVRARYALARARGETVGRLVIAHLIYPGTADEIGEKMFDFTAASIEGRWAAGYAQMGALLDRLAATEMTDEVAVVTAPA